MPVARRGKGDGHVRRGGNIHTFAKYLQTFSAAAPRSWLKGQASPAWHAPWRKNLQGTWAVSTGGKSSQPRYHGRLRSIQPPAKPEAEKARQDMTEVVCCGGRGIMSTGCTKAGKFPGAPRTCCHMPMRAQDMTGEAGGARQRCLTTSRHQDTTMTHTTANRWRRRN